MSSQHRPHRYRTLGLYTGTLGSLAMASLLFTADALYAAVPKALLMSSLLGSFFCSSSNSLAATASSAGVGLSFSVVLYLAHSGLPSGDSAH